MGVPFGSLDPRRCVMRGRGEAREEAHEYHDGRAERADSSLFVDHSSHLELLDAYCAETCWLWDGSDALFQESGFLGLHFVWSPRSGCRNSDRQICGCKKLAGTVRLEERKEKSALGGPALVAFSGCQGRA